MKRATHNGSFVKGIGLNLVEDFKIRGLDLSSFYGGGGIITINSSEDGLIEYNHIRASLLNDSRHRNQLTGIEIDNDLYRKTNSQDILFKRTQFEIYLSIQNLQTNGG